MKNHCPEGWEQIPLTSEEPWHGSVSMDITRIESLQINSEHHYNVHSDGIYQVEPGIQTVASDGFTGCSAWIFRNRCSGKDTFVHYWPGDTEEPAYRHLNKHHNDGEQYAIGVFGSDSRPAGIAYELNAGHCGPMVMRAIAVDTGHDRWGIVFDRRMGDLIVLRQRPVQSLLRYHVFDV